MSNSNSILKGKKILLGISGSIAAYKCAGLVRLLMKEGAVVQVIMTAAATDFVTPLTLSTLSKRTVFHRVSDEAHWNNHVELGLWADVMIVAPATANTLAKMANGICDNMLVAAYLSAKCPVWFAPAMDLDMWAHPSTQRNIQLLLSYGNRMIPVEHGELASGLVGLGRMAEPETIVAHLNAFFGESPQNSIWAGRSVLLTAGPTHEPIDPVRFIGNRSSGKMGIAIADALAERGATVTLLLGPTHLRPASSAVRTVAVQTAEEMFEAAKQHFETATVGILAAAVADYRPEAVATQKIKKAADDMVIRLSKTPDIAAHLGSVKKPNQLLVGFALETNDELAHAKSKLTRKNFDFIVLNSLQDAGAGFQHDTNKVTFLDKNGNLETFGLKPKREVALDIVHKAEQMLKAML